MKPSIIRKSKDRRLLRLFAAKFLISEGRPFTFCKKKIGKALYPNQRVVTVK